MEAAGQMVRLSGWEREEYLARVEHMARLIFRGASLEAVREEFNPNRKELDAARARARRMHGKKR